MSWPLGAAWRLARNSSPSSPHSPTAGWPWRLMQQHDVLVDLADQHHLRDLDGLRVGHAQPVDELDRQVEAPHVAGDVRAAAVHDHRVHPDVLEQHHVAGELLLERGVGHRRAAVLDHYGLAVELADVGQRLEQRARCRAWLRSVRHVVYSALIVTYSCPRSEKKTSVSAPSPGSPISYSTSSRGDRRRRAPPRRAGTHAPARAHLHALDRDVERQRRGAGQRHPDGLGDPAPVGVAAVERGLDQRRVRRPRARRARRRASSPPRTTTRPTAGPPRRRATIGSASWRSSASSASPKRSSSSVSGSTSTRTRRCTAGSPCRSSTAGRRR